MDAESAEDLLDDLGERFMAHSPRLHAIAQRTLGSPWSADDAVQETWLRLQRVDATAILNLEAWTTTVVSRVCIDLIRQREARHEGSTPEAPGDEDDAATDVPEESDPSGQVLRAEALTLAMQVVLEQLGPLERLALVLHDVFALPYEEIAPIVERSPAAARQLASRARTRLRAVDTASIREQQEGAIDAFLSAARGGDFGGLLQLLDPDIELRSDTTAVDLTAASAAQGAPLLDRSIHGGDAVARVFAGRADATRLIRVDGLPAAAYLSGGVVLAVYVITFRGDRIVRMDVLADRELLAGLQLAARDGAELLPAPAPDQEAKSENDSRI